MEKKRWFRYYLLVVGSTILCLGIVLFFRTLFERQAYTGLILGGVLIVYGTMRLRQRKRPVSGK